MISQRHLSRIVAMQTIFSLLHKPQSDFLKEFLYIKKELPEELKEDTFAVELIQGTLKNQNAIEMFIKKYSKDHDLDRVDTLTLSILLLAIYELQFSQEKQPSAVVINEAVELAKEYGKDTSSSLVNAILSKVKDNE